MRAAMEEGEEVEKVVQPVEMVERQVVAALEMEWAAPEETVGMAATAEKEGMEGLVGRAGMVLTQPAVPTISQFRRA